MDGGAWWAAVHRVAKSRTWLSDFTFTFHFHALKAMATHSSILAWRIPGTGEPVYGVAQSRTRLKRLSSSRPLCPSPTPRVHPNSCPSSRWCHPAISSSVVPFSSWPQSLPASESALRMRWPKYWSFSFSIIPSKEQPRLISFRMEWLDLLAVQGTLKSLIYIYL